MRNDESDRCELSLFLRHSTFVLRYLVHIPLVTLVALEFLNVFIGLLNALAAVLLNDFAQRCIDVFGHPACIATHEKVGAVGVDPFPNLGGIFRHPMLDIDLLRLIA